MKMIDLFAGAGGFTEGFSRAGFEPALAIEWDPAAAATYRVNFGPHVTCKDIGSVGAHDLVEADMVIGGPPCQGFSQLGLRNPDDPRNHLWREYADVVRLVQPRVFVLENVARFLKSDQFAMMSDWTARRGRLAGYTLVGGVLDAADFGVPQHRKRAIVVGSRVGKPSLPTPSHGPSARKPYTTLRSALAGVPLKDLGEVFPSRYLDDGIPGPFKAHELHLKRFPTKLSLKRYDRIPPGGGRHDLPRHLKTPGWQAKAHGTTDVMGRLEWNKPSVTIRTEFWKPEKGRYLHPQYDGRSRVNRPITHWEAARIQTFPDDFAWCGTRIEIARQIGNAVPPDLAYAIATHLAQVHF